VRLVSIVVSFLPAIVLAKRAGTSTAEFFTSGEPASGARPELLA